MKNSPRRPLNNTMNKLQIGNLMQSTQQDNASLYRPAQAAVTERDDTMRTRDLQVPSQNGVVLQGSATNRSKHLHGPRIDNNLNQYRRHMHEKEGEVSQTSSLGGSSKSNLSAQSNQTQEKDFTPGQHQQFKSFLKSQTVERDDATDEQLQNSLLASQATVAHESGTAGGVQLLSEQALQLRKNLNKQMQHKNQKHRTRAQTRQVQSKQDDDLVALRGGMGDSEAASTSVLPMSKKELSRRQNIRHIKQNSHLHGSNRMSPTPQPIPIEIFSHTESDGNNSSHRQDRKDVNKKLETTHRAKYRGGQKQFLMSKFALNKQHVKNQREPTSKNEGKFKRMFARQKKAAHADNQVKSDSMKSFDDSNANYDSSPQQTEQKSVRQMVLHTHEKDRGDDSDDQIIDFIDEEGERYDPAGDQQFLASR